MEEKELKSLGIETWGKGSRRTRGKASKLELIGEISALTNSKSLDIGNLTLADLKIVLTAAKEHKTIKEECPSGRFKKPYIDSLKPIMPRVENLEKLSVNSLKELIGAFHA